MENWKKAVIVGSAAGAAVLLVKGRRPAGILVAGVGLAVLASEYPQTFERIADLAPGPWGRGLRLVELISRAGQKLADVGKGPARPVQEYEI
jgi:hypothetical protein